MLKFYYKRIKYVIFGICTSIAFLLLQFLLAPSANAATVYNVTPTSTCSLLDAYTSIANGSAFGGCSDTPSAPYTINLAAGTYSLTGNLPAITSAGNITINGAGANSTIIDGGGSYAGISISAPSGGNTYSISNLTLQDFLTNSTQFIFSANGNIIADHIILRNNTCTDAAAPTCALLSGDESGANNVTISNSAFYNNTASVILDAGTFSESSSSTIVFNIFNNTFSNNNSAIIVVLNFSNTSTVTVNMTNNTIANNTYIDDTGDQGLIIINPPGVPVDTFTATANLKNNIFYANTNFNSGSRTCSTSLGPTAIMNSLGGNISSDATCSSLFNQTNDKNSTDSYLGLLTLSNGTYVRPLASNSPAIGNAIASGAPSVDQRGVARPQNGTYDSGAYEYVFGPSPSPSTNPSTTKTSTLANTNNISNYVILFTALLITIAIIIFAAITVRNKNKNAK